MKAPIDKLSMVCRRRKQYEVFSILRINPVAVSPGEIRWSLYPVLLFFCHFSWPAAVAQVLAAP